MASNNLPAPGEPDEFPLDQEKQSIIFVGAEVSPWAKTGGLGDVMRDLPMELAARGHRVMSVTPRYDQYAEGWDTSLRVTVKVGKNKEEQVSFFHCFHNGVDRVFVDHPCFLEKVWGPTGSKIYGPKAGIDYPDGPMRWGILCQAAIAAAEQLHLGGFPYGNDSIFVPNDWHAALLPLYLKAYYKPKGKFTNSKTLFILHNIVFQGRYHVEYFDDLYLPKEFFPDLAFESCFCSPPLDGSTEEPIVTSKPMRMINILKAGFIHSDRLLTVSPSFAEEVMSGRKLGVELDEFIREKGIIGIVNGMDMVKWNPMNDKYVIPGYDAATAWIAKRKVKMQLQKELGLIVDPDAPMVGFVGRLDPQKGIDLLMEAVPQLIDTLPGCQFVLLGTGQAHMMRRVKEIEAKDPTRIAGITKFSEAMEHKLTSAADYMAMPSRFEPCGLVQLHALRYGCVPIVTDTGGLRDSVIDGVTGYHMEQIPSEEYPGVKLSNAKLEQGIGNVVQGISKAVLQYGSETYKRMQQTGMNLDLTWTQGVQNYEREIKKALTEPTKLTKTEAELIRSERNGGVQASIVGGYSANGLSYPWSANSVSVDEGIKNNMFSSSATDMVADNSRVPAGGPVSSTMQQIRGGPNGDTSKADGKGQAQPAANGNQQQAPPPQQSTYNGNSAYNAPPSGGKPEIRQGFLGVFKRADGSKNVNTSINDQKGIGKNYASAATPEGTKYDIKPQPNSGSNEDATGSLTKISAHSRPSPTKKQTKAAGA